jgi:hypothetical protein
MVKRFSFYILFLFLVASQFAAQDFRARAEVDSSVYLVGDYIKVKYRIEYKEGVKFNLPSIKDSIPDLTFINELPVRQYDNNDLRIDEHTYVFSKYDSAGVVIPSIKFSYTGLDGNTKTTYSNEAAFDVKTIEVDAQADIQDVKSPLRIPLDWWAILIYVLIAIVIIAIGYFIYQKYIKKKTDGLLVKQVIKIPPHEIALKALRSLEEQKLWQQGSIKLYHTELTDIIRRYFEGRFNFLAMEMPSTDVLKNILEIGGKDNFYNSAESFFRNADLVKFAKFQPMPSINEQMMKQAYEIVDTTKQEEQPQKEEVANV